jgi:hypothetical protein
VVPGTANVLADRISRIKGDMSSAKLNPNLFKLITERFGKMDIDLFASELNRQVSRFVSWGPEPLAWYVDAFSRPLPQGLRMYTFPPFILLGRLLAKIRRERATMVLVAPMWTGQPWLTKMARAPPLLLPQWTDLLSLPGSPHPLPHQQPPWRMAAWLVSGES